MRINSRKASVMNQGSRKMLVHLSLFSKENIHHMDKCRYFVIMTSEKMAAIRELERIELIRQNDGEYRMDYAVTATQKEILKYLA